jgi:hypothetical protein
MVIPSRPRWPRKRKGSKASLGDRFLAAGEGERELPEGLIMEMRASPCRPRRMQMKWGAGYSWFYPSDSIGRLASSLPSASRLWSSRKGIPTVPFLPWFEVGPDLVGLSAFFTLVRP